MPKLICCSRPYGGTSLFRLAGDCFQSTSTHLWASSSLTPPERPLKQNIKRTVLKNSCVCCSRRSSSSGAGDVPSGGEAEQRRVVEEAAALGVTPERMIRILANRRSAAAAKARKAQHNKVIPHTRIMLPRNYTHDFTSNLCYDVSSAELDRSRRTVCIFASNETKLAVHLQVVR